MGKGWGKDGERMLEGSRKDGERMGARMAARLKFLYFVELFSYYVVFARKLYHSILAHLLLKICTRIKLAFIDFIDFWFDFCYLFAIHI
jgi:hypothetical protein